VKGKFLGAKLNQTGFRNNHVEGAIAAHLKRNQQNCQYEMNNPTNSYFWD